MFSNPQRSAAVFAVAVVFFTQLVFLALYGMIVLREQTFELQGRVSRMEQRFTDFLDNPQPVRPLPHVHPVIPTGKDKGAKE